MTTSIQAIYDRGVLRPKQRLPFHNREVVILRITTKPDTIEGTRGIIHVSRRFIQELTKPHRYNAVNR